MLEPAPTIFAALQASLSHRYRVGQPIGQGGMATVYRAFDLKHERDVALKVLDPGLSMSIGADRFQREIKLIARLQHPHILPLFDSGDIDGLCYYVCPLMAGASLRERLDRERMLPLDVAIRIATEVAGALDYAHRAGVVHRDIKPENILLHDGHALVADFGIARAINESAGGALTQTGFALGTAAYMSPEQAAGERDVDGRSDIYSLGCVLFEMLSGTTPFSGPSPQAIIARRFTETPPPLRQLRGAVPEFIDTAVAKALARDAPDRFQTAMHLASALESRAIGEPLPLLNHPDALRRAPARTDVAELHNAARALIERRDMTRLAEAEARLDRAVELDATFGPAHALRAITHLLRADMTVPLIEGCAAAVRAAREALRHDPHLGEAHSAIGLAHTLQWEWESAERELRKGRELSSTSALAHHWYAMYLTAVGRMEEADAAITAAVALCPADATLQLAAGTIAFYARDYPRAVTTVRRAVSLDPTMPAARVVLGLALAGRGAADEAVSEFERSLDLAGEVQPFALASLICTHAQNGRRAEACVARDRLASLGRRRDISPFYAASAATALGDTADAFAALASAHAQRDGWLLAVAVHPWMDSLHQDARFAELLGSMGLSGRTT